MMKILSMFMQHEKGATVVEYALIVGLIALVAFVAMPMVGNNTFTALREVSSNMDEVSSDLHHP
ncbi:MAG: Flp family type IVb pilin [Pseudomonadota bacterium]